MAVGKTGNGMTHSWVSTWGGLAVVAVVGVLFIVWAANSERKRKKMDEAVRDLASLRRKRGDRFNGEF